MSHVATLRHHFAGTMNLNVRATCRLQHQEGIASTHTFDVWHDTMNHFSQVGTAFFNGIWMEAIHRNLFQRTMTVQCIDPFRKVTEHWTCHESTASVGNSAAHSIDDDDAAVFWFIGWEVSDKRDVMSRAREESRLGVASLRRTRLAGNLHLVALHARQWSFRVTLGSACCCTVVHNPFQRSPHLL